MRPRRGQRARGSLRGGRSALAEQRALSAGAIEPTVTLEYNDIHVKDKVDGELFLESTVIATAIGRACDWRPETSP
jgi:hypothetical protein